MAGINYREYGYRPGTAAIARAFEAARRARQLVHTSSRVIGEQDGMRIVRNESGT